MVSGLQNVNFRVVFVMEMEITRNSYTGEKGKHEVAMEELSVFL